MDYRVTPSGSLKGELVPPGDKSISHRAVILAAIAHGTSVIRGFLHAEDTLATLRAVQTLGIQVDFTDDQITIQGQGLYGLSPSSQPIDCGNSGTSMRLLTGILVGQPFPSVLMGDASLSSRPMARIVDPLRLMGAQIIMTPEGTAPLQIGGGVSLKGIRYAMPIPSAQVKSCLLLAGVYAEGETVLTASIATRDHTERMLDAFGYQIGQFGPKIKIKGQGQLRATQIDVPGDISSAAFFIVAATLLPNSNILLKGVGINPYRIGIINILSLMGADIRMENERRVGDEYVADMRVVSSKLRGIDIPLDQVPLAIDEFPVIFIAAACAEGLTVLRGAQELHVKESDRIAVMAEGLARLGIHVEAQPDGMTIEGGVLQGGHVDSHGDHRVAMSFAIAGALAKEETTISGCEGIVTSYPNFIEHARELGIEICPS